MMSKGKVNDGDLKHQSTKRICITVIYYRGYTKFYQGCNEY
jgi:hypothetical protein